MFPAINPTSTKSWAKLSALKDSAKLDTREAFRIDKSRVSKFSFEFEDFYFDFSKNTIDDTIFAQLIELAKECQLPQAIKAQFAGELINKTEGRAVLHSALRNLSATDTNGKLVTKELGKIQEFTAKLHAGEFTGFSGKKITDVVNIGIGGSDLGPKMITYALKPYWKNITSHYVSNVDGAQIAETLESLNPETTLFIIASKTFTTQETMTNADTAKKWFQNKTQNNDISKNFVAVSTNTDLVAKFGIEKNNIFTFWDWVGGRYSLWSAIGLSIACAVGYDQFERLLIGANKMDEHFQTATLSENVPVISAMIGIWYNNFLNYESMAVLPYDHLLRFLPSFLQQGDMESNGKSVDREGKPLTYQTGPIVWGEPGTNGQHAFYQLIHQGTKIIPTEFIACVNPAHDLNDHHDKLLANFFAQPEALLNGKSKQQVQDEQPELDSDIMPFKVFTGNRPSTSILIDNLSPENLGALIAYYEQRIFVQGIIWNIFSFDQWGVELGKQLAKPILSEIKNKDAGSHDASTTALMKRFHKLRK